MQDQAHELRKIAWEKKRKAKYFTISSGKGGVGKTNFAVNLACALSYMGKKVLVFDADLGLANVDVLLNIKSDKTIKDYLSGKADLDSIIISSKYGFDILPSASGFVKLSNLSKKDFDKLIEIFIQIDEKYNYIIFDTGAGISKNVLRFAPLADLLIVITQPEPTAITDAYAFMKVVEQEYGIENIHLIVNRVKDNNSGKLIYDNLKKVVDKFLNLNLILTGFLREDISLIKSVKSQKPIFIISKTSKYSKDVMSIANSLTGIGEKVVSRYNLFDFIRRFSK
jgi:flagellar biosynthesis protein FlhG